MPTFRDKLPCVYIMASRKDGTLYTGVTSSLPDRVRAHRQSEVPGFTRRYRVDRLVHFEFHPTMQHAITREKQIKKWYRAWKIELIEVRNPNWRDLSSEVVDGVALE
jgi:putative endonuclease